MVSLHFEKNLFYFTSGSIFLLMDLFLLKVCSCRRVGGGNNGSVVSLENKRNLLSKPFEVD